MGKINILLAEDEALVAMDIKNVLRKLDYNVVDVVATGIDAVARAKELNPDLIIMDIMLKGDITGIEAATQIKEYLNIPVIYLTGLSDKVTLGKAKVTEPFGYILKPFDIRVLQTAVEMGIYKHSIEAELKNRTKELEEEKKKNDDLLMNILPEDIITELKLKGFAEPRHYNNVSIMFTDFDDFSDISSQLTPHELIKELNNIFNYFDEIIYDFGLEKLKTIGDAYMIASGLPKEGVNHAENIIKAALAMMDFVQNKNTESGFRWHLKAGINSGPVVAGIVGNNKYTYDVWGDTVNIASRMLSSGKPGKINVSGSTHNLVKDKFNCFYRGKLSAKGKGEVDMYFIE